MISTFVRADRIRLASLFRPKAGFRYCLQGVHIASVGNGVRVTATDGRRMAMFHDTAGFTCVQCIVQLPTDALAAIKRCKEKEFCWFGIIGEHDGTGRREARIFNSSNGAGGLDETREAMEDITHDGVIWAGAVMLIGGTFPDVHKIVPEKRGEATRSAAFQFGLLKEFGEVAEEARGKGAAIHIYPSGGKAALIDCGRSDFIGMLIPNTPGGASPLIAQGHERHAPAWAMAAAA